MYIGSIRSFSWLIWFLPLCLIDNLIILILSRIFFFVFLYSTVIRWVLYMLWVSCLNAELLVISGHHMVIPSIVSVHILGCMLWSLWNTLLFCNFNLRIWCFAIRVVIFIDILYDFIIHLLSTPTSGISLFLWNCFVFVLLHYSFFTYNRTVCLCIKVFIH